MKKNVQIAYLIAIFPITGFLGFHQLYLFNFKGFLLRIFLAFTIIGALAFWIYDLITLPKQVANYNLQKEKEISHIINLLDKGELKEALKNFVKTGYTKVFVKEIIKRGKGDVIVKHFTTTEKDKNDLQQLIKNGDTESLVIHLTSYYAQNKLNNFLNKF